MSLGSVRKIFDTIGGEGKGVGGQVPIETIESANINVFHSPKQCTNQRMFSQIGRSRRFLNLLTGCIQMVGQTDGRTDGQTDPLAGTR